MKGSRDWDIWTINFYEEELAKFGIEHKEPIPVGFFILQHAELKILGP